MSGMVPNGINSPCVRSDGVRRPSGPPTLFPLVKDHASTRRSERHDLRHNVRYMSGACRSSVTARISARRTEFPKGVDRVSSRIAYLIVSLLALSALWAHTAAASDRPNFVFVYTDDQRWDALGVVQKEMGANGRFPWFQNSEPRQAGCRRDPVPQRLRRQFALFAKSFSVSDRPLQPSERRCQQPH